MTSVLKGATPAGSHLVYSWLEKLPLAPLHYETQRASEEVCPALSRKQSSTFVLLCCFCFGLEIGEGYFKGTQAMDQLRRIFEFIIFFMCVCVKMRVYVNRRRRLSTEMSRALRHSVSTASHLERNQDTRRRSGRFVLFGANSGEGWMEGYSVFCNPPPHHRYI